MDTGTEQVRYSDSNREDHMSFLSDFWDLLNSPADEVFEKLYHSRSKQWVAKFAPPESAPKLATAIQSPIESGRHYISVTSQKTLLPYDRVLFKTFFGAVHSTIIIHDEDGQARSISTFASLDPALTAIDNRAGEKIVQGPRTLLEFAPFRGVAFGSTIALLAVEAVDYAKPLLATLQKLSNVAGPTFFSIAMPFAEPLISGIQSLSEVAGGSGTQIVFAGNLPLHTGIFLIAATSASGFDWKDYSIDPDYTLLFRGNPVTDFAYMILTIQSTEDRPNWREIPAIRQAEAALDSAVRAAGRKIAEGTSMEREKVEDALLVLQWECLRAPDLCEEDAKRIADNAQIEIDTFIQRASRRTRGESIVQESRSDREAGFSLEAFALFPRPKSKSPN